MKRWVSWYRSTDILYRGKDRVARGQTPPLSVMLPSPLSLFSIPGFAGITQIQMVFVFPRAPASQCLTYVTWRKLWKESQMTLGTKFSRQLSLSRSQLQGVWKVSLSRQRNPPEEFSKTVEFLCCPTNAQFSIPNPFPPVKCIFWPQSGLPFR